LREERKQELEEHVQAVNALLKTVEQESGELGSSEEDAWEGIQDDEPVVELVDHEEEYIDEDRYTTVTVEAVNISKEGLHKTGGGESNDETSKTEAPKLVEAETSGKTWPKKTKKKFRYESKAERRITQGKQKAGRKARADARRGND
jgi:ribosomal RNA-processing protein 17